MSDHVDVVAGEAAIWRGSGGREIAGFIGVERPLFTVLHAPDSTDRGLVVCSPVYAEFMQNYGREVRLARTLASEGVAVARCHYRGAGDSAGAPEDMTIESMTSDVLATVDHLKATTGVERVDVLGTRLGGHVAAAVATQIDGAALVLWEPATDMKRYFDEIFRARRMVGAIAQESATSSSGAMLEELAEAGRIDVVGYHLHRALYESASAASLEAIGAGARRVLLVQTSRSGSVKGSTTRLADGLGGLGHDVDVQVVPPGEGWWIHDYDEDRPPDDRREAEAQLISATVRWLVAP